MKNQAEERTRGDHRNIAAYKTEGDGLSECQAGKGLLLIELPEWSFFGTNLGATPSELEHLSFTRR